MPVVSYYQSLERFNAAKVKNVTSTGFFGKPQGCVGQSKKQDKKGRTKFKKDERQQKLGTLCQL